MGLLNWLLGRDKLTGRDNPDYTPDPGMQAWHHQRDLTDLVEQRRRVNDLADLVEQRLRANRPHVHNFRNEPYRPGRIYPAEPGGIAAVTADNICDSEITAGTVTFDETLTLNGWNPAAVRVNIDGYRYKLVRDDCSEED